MNDYLFWFDYMPDVGLIVEFSSKDHWQQFEGIEYAPGDDFFSLIDNFNDSSDGIALVELMEGMYEVTPKKLALKEIKEKLEQFGFLFNTEAH